MPWKVDWSFRWIYRVNSGGKSNVVRLGTVNDTDLLDFEDWGEKAFFMLAGPFFDTNPIFGSLACRNQDSKAPGRISFLDPSAPGRFNPVRVSQVEVACPVRDRSRLVVID